MAYYHIPDKDSLIPCPYDKVHMIEAKRMQYHLMKCRRNHTGREYATCPFNARHEMPKPELRYHIANCPDKAMLEPLLSYEQSKNSEEGKNFKGCTDLPKYDDHLESGRPGENWDEEIPENPRIGVDPAYFARMEYKDIQGMSRSEKKKWKNQYSLPADQRKLPMQEQNEEEDEGILRKPHIKSSSFVITKPPQPQTQVLSYSLAMAGIGRGGGTMGMPNQQPAGVGRGVGRAKQIASVRQGFESRQNGMSMGEHLPNGVNMQGLQTIPPVGRAMGRAKARENNTQNFPMNTVNGTNGINDYRLQNGSAIGNNISAPPGFTSQFANADQLGDDSDSPSEKENTAPSHTPSHSPNKLAGIGRGRGIDLSSPSTFSVGIGRGVLKENSPAFVVPRVAPSTANQNEESIENRNESIINMSSETKAKEMKKIEKKLKQIELLEEKGDQGYKFNSDEMKKILAKDNLMKMLEDLKL